MKKALDQAQQALAAGEFPVGCVLAYNGEVVAAGARRGTAGECVNELDHAEMLAIRRLSELNNPLAPEKLALFSTMEPCLMCYGAILLHGIGRIVYAYEDVMGGGTGYDLTRLPALYSRSAVRIVPHVLRDESLALFKTFFRNPDNAYWRGSLLAEYTLAQNL